MAALEEKVQKSKANGKKQRVIKLPKIAILGGTFNPVHIGHIAIAKAVLKNTDVNKVLFLPTGNPHYKTADVIADKHHRYNMLSLAIKGFRNMEISDYEINSQGPCYTVDTMRHFKKQNPQNSYCFIIGADSLDYLHKWKDASNLIKENEFIVINRNFKQNYNIDKNIEYISSLGGKVTKADMPFCDVSSSLVRELLQNKEDVSKYTGDDVYAYIVKNQLYIGRNLNDH